MPWRRRVKNIDGPGFDVPLGDDPISVVLGIILLILLLPLIVLALIGLLELLLLVLLLPIAVLARVMFGSHWHVEVRRGWAPIWETAAGDWQHSGLVIHDVAQRLRRGEDLPGRTPTATGKENR